MGCGKEWGDVLRSCATQMRCDVVWCNVIQCDVCTTINIRAHVRTYRVCFELCARSDPLSLPARSMKLSFPMV